MPGEGRRLEHRQTGVAADGAGGVVGGARVHPHVAHLHVVDVELGQLLVDLEAVLLGGGEVDPAVLLPGDLGVGVACGGAGERGLTPNVDAEVGGCDGEDWEDWKKEQK